jgi:hypothetical protein
MSRCWYHRVTILWKSPLYKTLLNDISFEIAQTLVVLIEHQSTINPNMSEWKLEDALVVEREEGREETANQSTYRTTEPYSMPGSSR